MMVTRREVALGGLVTILWGSQSCTCNAQSLRSRHTFGCILTPEEAEQFLATSTSQQLFVTGNEPIIASSGNRDFDYALAQTLSRLSDAFEVLPGFAYYDDFDGKNAYATNVRRLSRADGAVLFGKRLFILTMSAREHPEVALSAVCAHEFAHILQFKRGLDRSLLAGQSTVKPVELHADFLAGYFAGIRKLQKPDYPAAVFAVTQYSVGDNIVNHPNHHGRHEERAAAVVRGFEVAYRERRSLADAIQSGVNYVSSL